MIKNVNQKGFSAIGVIIAVAALAVVAGGGYVVFQHNKTKPTSAASGQTATSASPSSSPSSSPQAPTVTYLDIKEWGIKLPLSANIRNAYYVIPSGVSPDADGKPSGAYLSVTQLNATCGDASAGNTNRSIEHALGEIVRTKPTDSDPVTGKLYTQQLPNGIMIGDYYYGYGSDIKNLTCASQTLLQNIDSAFADAIKNAITDTPSQ